MKENSIGSVMPVRKEVRAAEIMRLPTAARCSGLAARHMATAAPGRPNILNRKAPARIPAVRSPAKNRAMSPWTICPLAAL